MSMVWTGGGGVRDREGVVGEGGGARSSFF